MKSLLSGVSCFTTGISLLKIKGIRIYALIPSMITLLIFSLFIVVGFSHLTTLSEWYLSKLPEWLAWVDWIISPIIMISYIFVGFFMCLMFANLLASPFNSVMSRAIAKHLGFKPNDNTTSFLSEIVPAIKNEFIKLKYYLLFAVPLLLLFLIPIINLIAPFLWLLFSIKMLSLEYLEFPIDNEGHDFSYAKQWVNLHKINAYSFGSIVFLLTATPILNFFVMPIAVASATVLYYQEKSINS